MPAGMPGEVSPRFYTVVPIALAFFYAYWRLNEVHDQLAAMEKKFRAAEICCWLGTISVGSLMRFETGSGLGGGGLGCSGICTAGDRMAQRAASISLPGALVVVAGVLFRTVLHNFYERSYFPAPCVGEPLGHGWRDSRAAARILADCVSDAQKRRTYGRGWYCRA